jgi:hypothetical protein
MVTGVLGLLLLQFGLTARDQVEQSQRLLDRARAELRWHTREADLKFDLLTQPWVADPSSTSAGGVAALWRFDNQAFEVSGDSMRLQDVSGLLSLPQGAGSMEEFQALLVAIGVAPDKAVMVAAGLLSRLTTPDSLPLQSVLELQYLGLTTAEIEKLRVVTTSYPNQSFNPSTAPREVLIARYRSSSIQDALLRLREQEKLDSTGYAAVLDSPAEDFTVFFPGPVFRWQIEAREGKSGVGRERTWVVRPYDSQPLLLWESRDVSLMGPI